MKDSLCVTAGLFSGLTGQYTQEIQYHYFPPQRMPFAEQGLPFLQRLLHPVELLSEIGLEDGQSHQTSRAGITSEPPNFHWDGSGLCWL